MSSEGTGGGGEQIGKRCTGALYKLAVVGVAMCPFFDLPPTFKILSTSLHGILCLKGNLNIDSIQHRMSMNQVLFFNSISRRSQTTIFSQIKSLKSIIFRSFALQHCQFGAILFGF